MKSVKKTTIVTPKAKLAVYAKKDYICSEGYHSDSSCCRFRENEITSNCQKIIEKRFNTSIKAPKSPHQSRFFSESEKISLSSKEEIDRLRFNQVMKSNCIRKLYVIFPLKNNFHTRYYYLVWKAYTFSHVQYMYMSTFINEFKNVSVKILVYARSKTYFLFC